MADATIRWGILGPGVIAAAFAADIALAPGATITAVASRSRERAAAFARQFDIPRVHGGYKALAADPEVDVVYVATPHSFHKAHTILCLNHGKAVLCEKPFAINAAQAREMVAAARANGRLLMEAMWTRFLPVMARLRALIDEGAIGDVRMIQADFGFRTDFDPAGRLFDLALGGGGLLDVGVYPLSFVHMLLGDPARIVGLAELGATGVDEQAAVVLGFDNGALATLATAVRTETPSSAVVLGTDGWIELDRPFWRAGGLSVYRPGRAPARVDAPPTGVGYFHEAVAFGEALRDGRLEHDLMPLDASLALMATMDAIRAQWGLRYPME